MCSTVIQHLIHFYQPSGGSVAPNDLNCQFWPKIDHFWAISETQPVIKNVKKCVLITRVSPQSLLKPLKLVFTWKTDVALISLHCPIWHTVPPPFVTTSVFSGKDFLDLLKKMEKGSVLVKIDKKNSVIAQFTFNVWRALDLRICINFTINAYKISNA